MATTNSGKSYNAYPRRTQESISPTAISHHLMHDRFTTLLPMCHFVICLPQTTLMPGMSTTGTSQRWTLRQQRKHSAIHTLTKRIDSEESVHIRLLRHEWRWIVNVNEGKNCEQTKSMKYVRVHCSFHFPKSNTAWRPHILSLLWFTSLPINDD